MWLLTVVLAGTVLIQESVDFPAWKYPVANAAQGTFQCVTPWGTAETDLRYCDIAWCRKFYGASHCPRLERTGKPTTVKHAKPPARRKAPPKAKPAPVREVKAPPRDRMAAFKELVAAKSSIGRIRALMQ